jgi:hypothetical protein
MGPEPRPYSSEWAARRYDTEWVLKVYAQESWEMMKLAEILYWPEISKYYEVEMENAASLIRGEVDYDSYLQLSKQNEVPLTIELAAFEGQKTRLSRSMSKNMPFCKVISETIIGKSKFNASN